MDGYETYWLEQEDADKIEAFVFNEEIYWTFTPDVTFPVALKKDQISTRIPGFNACIIKDGMPTKLISNLAGLLDRMNFNAITKHLDQYRDQSFNVRRLQFWMYPNRQGAGKIPHRPHIDFGEYNKTGLYFVNDCEADTVFFKIKDQCKEEFKKEIEDGYQLYLLFQTNKLTMDHLEEIHREKSEKGKLVLFDGYTIHASSSAEDEIRVTLNFNLQPVT